MRAEATRLAVARREIPGMARAAQTPDAALEMVREAVEADPTLRAMGENRLDDEELLELVCEAADAERGALVRALARRRIARKLARQNPRLEAHARGETDPGPDQVNGYMEGIIEELEREGYL